MTYNAADRKDIRRAEKSAKLAESARVEFLRVAMSTTQGREFIHDLLVRCHMFEPSFTPDALITAFREGERNIGLTLFTDIVGYCPDQYTVMMQEAHHRSITNEQRRHNDHGPDEQHPGSEDAEWGADRPNRGDAE